MANITWLEPGGVKDGFKMYSSDDLKEWKNEGRIYQGNTDDSWCIDNQKNEDQGGIVTGTGHNSVTISPDGKQMLCVYHGRTSLTGEKRVVFIDPMEISEDGTLVVYGPTTKE